jgi:hypothetical protein
MVMDFHGLTMSKITRRPDDTFSGILYLFDPEEEILREKGDEIVAAMHRYSGGVLRNELVLELGAG